MSRLLLYHFGFNIIYIFSKKKRIINDDVQNHSCTIMFMYKKHNDVYSLIEVMNLLPWAINEIYVKNTIKRIFFWYIY